MKRILVYAVTVAAVCSVGVSSRNVEAVPIRSHAHAAPRPNQIKEAAKEPTFVVKQPTSMTCWAATATMMRSWKGGSLLKITAVMDSAGPQYRAKFDANKTLLGSEKAAFLSSLGLKAEAPQNFTVQGWADLIRRHGLLWVTTNEGTDEDFAIHASVIHSIEGNGSPDATFFGVIDPATGTASRESVQTFVMKFESVAKIDSKRGDLRPQVVHF